MKNSVRIMAILFVMVIMVLGMGYSFAYMVTDDIVFGNNTLIVSDLDFSMQYSEAIELNELLPTIDKFGIENPSFDFVLTNNSEVVQNYVIRLIDNKFVSTLPNNNVRYSLVKNEERLEPRNLTDSGSIDSGIINPHESITYSLTLWVDGTISNTKGTFRKYVEAIVGQVNLDNSGANAPVLKDNMIPVYFDSNDQVWRKADKDNNNINYQWYDYEDKMWANAVTVNINNRNKYITSSLGTEINIDDINGFFVWIPRFKYTLFEDVNSIKVEFETGLKSTGTVKCTKKFTTNSSENCTDNTNKGLKNNESTYTHPAFTFNREELPGLWIGKFNNSLVNNNIVINPKYSILTDIDFDSISTRIRRMEVNNNIYGFDNEGDVLLKLNIIEDSNDIDTHLIKNSEWGALTYLTYSNYGYNSVENNNYEYTSDLGVNRSSTGNVYGVYDINGEKEFISTLFSDKYVENIYKDVYTKYEDVKSTKLGDASYEINKKNVKYEISVVSPLYRDGLLSIDYDISNKGSSIGSRTVLKISSDVYITKW